VLAFTSVERTAVGTVELGSTGLQISRVGFGAWAIGGEGWWHAWGAQDDEESIAAIRHAVELGVNWVDTAPIYGLGHSEEVVGRALQGLAERPYVFTKASLYEKDGAVAHSLKRDSLRREVEASLSRLQLDVIDVYQIHWPDPDEDVEEAWRPSPS
jgi:aryl-alcohol dehydrogenase-like predicted oxidoreductase